MISKNYKKIAIVDINETFENVNYEWSAKDINLNLPFEPKIVIVSIHSKNNGGYDLTYASLCSGISNSSSTKLNCSKGLQFYIDSFSKNGIRIYHTNIYDTKAIQVIAIE